MYSGTSFAKLSISKSRLSFKLYSTSCFPQSIVPTKSAVEFGKTKLKLSMVAFIEEMFTTDFVLNVISSALNLVLGSIKSLKVCSSIFFNIRLQSIFGTFKLSILPCKLIVALLKFVSKVSTSKYNLSISKLFKFVLKFALNGKEISSLFCLTAKSKEVSQPNISTSEKSFVFKLKFLTLASKFDVLSIYIIFAFFISK